MIGAVNFDRVARIVKITEFAEKQSAGVRRCLYNGSYLLVCELWADIELDECLPNVLLLLNQVALPFTEPGQPTDRLN